jgi:hypothetical protein
VEYTDMSHILRLWSGGDCTLNIGPKPKEYCKGMCPNSYSVLNGEHRHSRNTDRLLPCIVVAQKLKPCLICSYCLKKSNSVDNIIP